MKRLARRITLAAGLAGILAIPAVAQPAAEAGFGGHHGGPRSFLRCLRDLNLTDSQKADIKTIVQDSHSTLQAAHEAMKADHDKIIADADAGADKATIGQDFLTVRADRQKIQAAISAIQAQVASKLTDDQRTKFQACSDAKKSAAMGRRGDSF
ncbi:MAG TPA: periplasmic heavy metal sensor [Thermoanaerobaculia bacterium]|nr:periplasmic heavy metal sensor [Thermoanaerobaculia bacterium]